MASRVGVSLRVWQGSHMVPSPTLETSGLGVLCCWSEERFDYVAGKRWSSEQGLESTW